MAEFRIETERLILRGWRDEDIDPFHALCSDPRVMAYLGPPQSRAQVMEAIARQRAFQAALGHCFLAVERREDGAMIGFCGLKPGPDGTPLAGQTEIGWRLAAAAWGKGYAREAAEASLSHGFDVLGCDSIWAMTVPANTASWGLMERLGMTRRSALDFDHLAFAPGHPLRAHICYTIGRDI